MSDMNIVSDRTIEALKRAKEVIGIHLDHWIRLLAEGICDKAEGKETVEAFQAAIEALKEPCEDCVSREHLLSEIDELMQSPWFNNGKDDRAIPHYGYVERKEAVEIVRDLCVKTEPPATPKPKTGKWIKVVTETDSFGNETYHHECSVCRCNKSGWGEYRFCPSCGAKMEGESE